MINKYIRNFLLFSGFINQPFYLKINYLKLVICNETNRIYVFMQLQIKLINNLTIKLRETIRITLFFSSILLWLSDFNKKSYRSSLTVDTFYLVSKNQQEWDKIQNYSNNQLGFFSVYLLRILQKTETNHQDNSYKQKYITNTHIYILIYSQSMIFNT